MNPFTRFLRSQATRPEPRGFGAFVEGWDTLEALVIHVYRTGAADTEVEAAHRDLRQWLAADYPRWESALAPYWPEALESGVPAPSDPFLRLLAYPTAADFVDNRAAMKALPPAREAINRYLLTLGAL